MKNLLFSAFIFLHILAKSQTLLYNESINSPNYKVQSVNAKLPLISVDTCLLNILAKIYQRDIHCPYHKENLSCFLISCSNQKNFYLLNVLPKYLNNLDSANYFGVINYDSVKFICYGDLNKKIFSSLNSDSVSIEYTIPKLKTSEDSIEYLKDNKLLCDGCLSKWSIVCKDLKIVIIASICNEHDSNPANSKIKRKGKGH